MDGCCPQRWSIHDRHGGLGFADEFRRQEHRAELCRDGAGVLDEAVAVHVEDAGAPSRQQLDESADAGQGAHADGGLVDAGAQVGPRGDDEQVGGVGEHGFAALFQHGATGVVGEQDPGVAARIGLQLSFSNDYLATFNRANVTLETTPISAITPTGVRVESGAEHAADVLILATGFKVMESGNMPTYDLHGVGGRDLETWWDENRLQAYEGVSVPGFPNFFSIIGPYGYNGASYFTLIENQTRHIMRCLHHARATAAARIEITEEANDRYFREVLARRGGQVFWQDSCATANRYYFDKHGDVPLRPASTLEAASRSGHFPLEDYVFS